MRQKNELIYTRYSSLQFRMVHPTFDEQFSYSKGPTGDLPLMETMKGDTPLPRG
jgi:hypothetical protein